MNYKRFPKDVKKGERILLDDGKLMFEVLKTDGKYEVEAKVIYTGNSSLHIALEVNACDPKSLNRRLTTHCIVIMVAVDQNGQSEHVPQWVPITEDDKKQHKTAIKLMEMRKQIGEEMQIFVD